MIATNEIIKSFRCGLAAAVSGNLADDEIYDSALRFVCNDFNLRASYADMVIGVHFDAVGYPASWKELVASWG